MDFEELLAAAPPNPPEEMGAAEAGEGEEKCGGGGGDAEEALLTALTAATAALEAAAEVAESDDDETVAALRAEVASLREALQVTVAANAALRAEGGNEERAESACELGCEHYKRRCALVAPCCNKVYSCRLCHDEVEHDAQPDVKQKHKVDRRAVQEMVCLVCDARQPVAGECAQCHAVMARYVCLQCKLFDDEGLVKKIFHCDDCAICRVGPRENYFHCHGCGMCLSTEMRDHRCHQESMHQNCPVCQEYLFDSRTSATVLECGHTMHVQCRNDMIRARQYVCPVCSVSIVDMSATWAEMREVIALTPMPEECKMIVRILCNDCNQETDTDFHIDGLECRNETCGSFNTRRV